MSVCCQLQRRKLFARVAMNYLFTYSSASICSIVADVLIERLIPFLGYFVCPHFHKFQYIVLKMKKSFGDGRCTSL